jgi:hypothetical protein
MKKIKRDNDLDSKRTGTFIKRRAILIKGNFYSISVFNQPPNKLNFIAINKTMKTYKYQKTKNGKK